MQRPSRWPDGRAPTPGASSIFSLTAPSTTKTSTLSLHDALPICCQGSCRYGATGVEPEPSEPEHRSAQDGHRRSEEHTSELQSLTNLVCHLLLEKKQTNKQAKPLTSHPPIMHLLVRDELPLAGSA